MTELTLKNIEDMIYIIRGQKVMLDSDMADLYGVETRIINSNVRRNIQRFPDDFMFQLTEKEYGSLKSQIGISKEGRGGRRKLPFVFSENGIAMLSSVLNSERAIQVNISIMRIFTQLRSFLMLEKDLTARVDRLDKYEEMITPKLPPNRKKIGLD